MAARKTISDWFLTEKGKHVSFLVAGGLSSAVLVGHILPNTILVSKYRDTIRLYSKGFSVPVPQKIQERFSKTLELLQIEPNEQQNIKPFMVAGFDIYSIGTFGRFGRHIGIPANFTYDKVQDIDKSKIKVNLESVVWDSQEGKQLLNSLVLPENAQMYAMAREIKMRNSYKFFYDTFFSGVAVIFVYGLSSFLNRKFNLFLRPRPVRVINYTLVSLLGFGNYALCKDVTQTMYERQIDEELRETHPVFAEGGREFYTKILERNKALRKLMGKEGERTYSVLGNENYFIRSKHMSLVHRKQIFESKDMPTDTPREPTKEQLIS